MTFKLYNLKISFKLYNLEVISKFKKLFSDLSFLNLKILFKLYNIKCIFFSFRISLFQNIKIILELKFKKYNP